MDKTNRNWSVLLVGGVSGSGKSSFSYALGRHYGVKVIEVDDLKQAIQSVTTGDHLPYIHYFESGVNWLDIGVQGNVDWLIHVSSEMNPVLKAVIDRHLEDNLPVIIEGDFIHPELVQSLHNPQIKALFLKESDPQQLIRNYSSREGGQPQTYRADISIEYGKWQEESCKRFGIPVIDVRPWDTAVTRAIDALK